MNKSRIILFIFSITIVVAVLIWIFALPHDTSSPASADNTNHFINSSKPYPCDESRARLTPATNPADTELTVYHNDKYHYSFTYPKKTWCVQGDEPDSVTAIRRSSPHSILGVVGVNPAGTSTLESIVKRMTNLPRQKFVVVDYYNYAGENAVELYWDGVVDGGKSPSQDPRREIIFIKDGYRYDISTSNPAAKIIPDTFIVEP